MTPSSAPARHRPTRLARAAVAFACALVVGLGSGLAGRPETAAAAPPSHPIPSLPRPSVPVPPLKSVPPRSLPTPTHRPSLPPLPSVVPSPRASTPRPAATPAPARSHGPTASRPDPRPSASPAAAGGTAAGPVDPPPGSTTGQPLEAVAPAPSAWLGEVGLPAIAGTSVLLILAVLLAQVAGGAVWIPVVRRALGGIGVRPPGLRRLPGATVGPRAPRP